MDAGDLPALLASWGYPALLVLLLLTGIGSPVPEDLLLLAAGYLTSNGVFHWPWVLAISWCGVVASDLMLYVAGRHLAWHSSRWSDAHLLSPERLRRATRWFDRFGHALILVARLAPGTRAVVFLTAGVRSIPPLTFLAYDALGALMWVPLVLAAGHRSGRYMGDLAALSERLERGAIWVLLLFALLFLFWLARGREESKL